MKKAKQHAHPISGWLDYSPLDKRPIPVRYDPLYDEAPEPEQWGVVDLVAGFAIFLIVGGFLILLLTWPT